MNVPGRVLLLAIGCAQVLAHEAARATVLPPGFAETQFVYVAGPTTLAFDPDGGLWIGEIYLESSILLYQDGLLREAVVIPTAPGGERGIESVAVDPDYAQNGRVWVYYTADNPPHNRLSHFTNVGGQLMYEVPVVEGPTLESVFHNGGCLAFASDKTLYLGMGDDLGGSNTAQNPFDLRGKILHINRDGTPAWDNPFRDGAAGDPRVWALGLRNPFRCSVQPGTDALFVGDVGAGSWEEIDIGVAGGNFGWEDVEGPEPSGLPGQVYPVHAYAHAVAGESYAVIAGKHVPAGAFDAAYEGSYFYGDWAQSDIRRLVLDENNQVVDSEIWSTNEYGPSDFAFGPDGALYYAGHYGAGIFRIAWEGGSDRQPTARLAAAPQGGLDPLPVLFDASASSDPDGDRLTYTWDFGDGSSLTIGGAGALHTYDQGTYDARVTVDDQDGHSVTSPAVRIVAGNEPPAVDVHVSASTYVAGQTIAYAGDAVDPQEGSLPCSQYAWQVLFHHTSHAHPFMGPLLGSCSGAFTIAERGETAPDTWYELRMTASDTGIPIGIAQAVLATTKSVELHPLVSRMTFETAPRPDLTLTLDAGPFTAPRSVDGVVNQIRGIGAVDGQIVDGRRYRFRSWSDGGRRAHEIRTPAADGIFTARFGCNVLEPVSRLQIDKAPNDYLALSWSTVGDECINDRTARYRVYVTSSLRPSSGPGHFPVDPKFTRVASVRDGRLAYIPIPAHRYFLVVPVGSDGSDGPAGHYEASGAPTPGSGSGDIAP